MRIMGNNNSDENKLSDTIKNPVEMEVDEAETSEEEAESSQLGASRVVGKSPAPSNPTPAQQQIKKMKLENETNSLPEENLQPATENFDSDDDISSTFDDDDDYFDTEEEVSYPTADGNSQEDDGEEGGVLTTYEVLSPEDIARHMEDCIEDANEVLQLPSTLMRVLLNHCGWDKEKLHDAYFGGGDSDKLLQDAGVASPTNPAQSESSDLSTKDNGVDGENEENCPVCLSTNKPAEMHALKCGHRFCADCWTEYLKAKIMGEGVGIKIMCLEHECRNVVDYDTVMKFAQRDLDMKSKYEQLICNSFVQSNRFFTWCPSPDCTQAIKVNLINERGHPVQCKCGHIFCFHCGGNNHDPVTCALLQKWIQKCHDDSENSNWIAANTKDCPKCKVRIQKNGGCNHMTCTNSSCGHEFCWICLGPWNRHDPYRCNQYDENEGKEARQAQDVSRQALHRYLFYFNRYSNHQLSLKLEHKLYELVEQMQDQNTSYLDVQFLKEAIDVLCKSRQTLMYTYVLSFYLAKTNETEIFADNQNDLQASVEKLSSYLERDINSGNMMDMKVNVVHLSKYCKKRGQVLIDHVVEGYEKETWNYIV